MSNKSCLYVVATPIGNLMDLSPRAAFVLQEVDIIASEDTRHTLRLMQHLNIKNKNILSYHDHNEESRAGELISRMLATPLKVALVSDAGTPCISDPGYRLVKMAKKAGLQVTPIPGASALTALVSAAGLACNRLLFIGFLPTKTSALEKEIQSWLGLSGSVVCYESAKRLPATLNIIAQHMPTAEIAIGRELTKLHEEIITTTTMQALDWSLSHTSLKGELVLMITPAEKKVDLESLRQTIILQAKALVTANIEMTHKDLMRHFANSELEKKDLYNCLLQAIKNLET